MKHKAGVFALGLAAVGGFGACVPDETITEDTVQIAADPLTTTVDERVRIDDPRRFPFNTVAKVKLGPDGHGRGSGFLVAPCTLLTAGHVVWNGDANDWRVIASVHPGSYYDEAAGEIEDPYQSAVPSGQATNTSWTATLDPDYDYGAIFVASSFESLGLDTYMPVMFDEEPGFINMSGYPSEDLPDTDANADQEQWRGFGNVERYDDRIMYYDATSTGGASGAPVWSLDGNGDRHVVSVDRAHSATYPGIGTRFVAANENAVEGWIAHTCDVTARRAANLFVDGTTMRGAKIERLATDVMEPAHTERLVRARSVVQYIEGQVYRWDEYRSPDDGRRALHLTRPESRWLGADEASLLLGASTLWMKPAAPVTPVIDPDRGHDVAVTPPIPNGRKPHGPEASVER